ncbi:MAG: DUF1592 domain-containing protein, partial [Lentisphaeraceae bacterium]|nr:DUF1592 domain-containing protein [Lentisphaeraceae bacterium]
PAVKNGKLAFPKPNDPDGTEYALHKKNFFFLNPTSNDLFKVKDAGWYKFSINGYAKHTKGKSIRIKVGYGALRNKAVVPKIAGYAFLEEDKPESHSFEVFLQPGEFFRVEEVSDGVRKISDDELNGYVGPFSVIQSLSFEGPRYNNWPRKGHQTIFGKVDPQALDRTKVESILTSVAPKIFRRPVSKSKLAKYMALYDSFAKEDKSLDSLKSTLQAMMVSPDFLYHYEGKDKVDDYALASRLSYFLWRSTPDNELLRLASSNKLSQPKVLDQQVKRLLEDSRSKRFIKDFVGQWLQINKIGEMRPSRELYPEYDEQLEQAMIEETYGFITEVFEKNLNIDNFIDSDWTILNERLAKLYRIKGISGLQFRKVKLDKANTVRGGLLTQASILNVTSNGTTTSPVIRGVWMLDHFLGTPSPPPPPDVPPIEPDIRGATTIKEQLAKHREIETCSACHKKIDPYGVALENFDVIGGWRNRYRALKPGKKKKQVLSSGKQVEAFDAIPGVGKYKDFKEFRSIIMDNKQLVHHNIAHKLATFALGRSLDFSDRDHLHHVVKESLKKGNGFRTMITELVLNPIFTKP